MKTYNVVCHDYRGGYVCSFTVEANNWKEANEKANTKCWQIKAHGKKAVTLVR